MEKAVDIKNKFYNKIIVWTVDNKLRLDKHVENIYQKARRNQILLQYWQIIWIKLKVNVYECIFFDLIIILLFGCFTGVHKMIKLINCIKDI